MIKILLYIMQRLPKHKESKDSNASLLSIVKFGISKQPWTYLCFTTLSLKNYSFWYFISDASVQSCTILGQKRLELVHGTPRVNSPDCPSHLGTVGNP